MRRKFEQYSDTIQRLYPELWKNENDKILEYKVFKAVIAFCISDFLQVSPL